MAESFRLGPLSQSEALMATAAGFTCISLLTGTDVYRVLSLPKYKGALLDTVVVVEFEKTRGR